MINLSKEFKLKIALGNSEMDTLEDVADALEDVTKRMRHGAASGKILDANGNAVGGFGIEITTKAVVLAAAPPKAPKMDESKGVFGDEPFRMGSDVSGAGSSMR